eukprot:Pompholyxophrys_punicea_v1_NODE_17_length_5980_cov_2.985654.p6 type:complete len:229 gc:universal NODE_17_length_5980_cov_2.985654:516-1202(+)
MKKPDLPILDDLSRLSVVSLGMPTKYSVLSLILPSRLSNVSLFQKSDMPPDPFLYTEMPSISPMLGRYPIVSIESRLLTIVRNRFLSVPIFSISSVYSSETLVSVLDLPSSATNDFLPFSMLIIPFLFSTSTLCGSTTTFPFFGWPLSLSSLSRESLSRIFDMTLLLITSNSAFSSLRDGLLPPGSSSMTISSSSGPPPSGARRHPRASSTIQRCILCWQQDLLYCLF